MECENTYSAENLMNYSLAISLIEKLESEQLLSPEDGKNLRNVMRMKYGLPEGSIYAA